MWLGLRIYRRSFSNHAVCPVVCLLLLTLPACQSRKTFLNQNDELRAERQALIQRVEELEQQLNLRETEIDALRNAESSASPIPGVEPARLVGIILGRYSGGIDTNSNGKPDQLRVYLRPVDQDGRFMSANGAARVRLIHTPANGDPIIILDQTWDPAAFRDSYRSGFTGTHYTLATDLPEDLPTVASLHVDFTEAGQGRSYSVQRPIELSIVVRETQEQVAE